MIPWRPRLLPLVISCSIFRFIPHQQQGSRSQYHLHSTKVRSRGRGAPVSRLDAALAASGRRREDDAGKLFYGRSLRPRRSRRKRLLTGVRGIRGSACSGSGGLAIRWLGMKSRPQGLGAKTNRANDG